MSVDVALRFAIAIVLDACAFVVWDVGTRPPAQLVRDVTVSVRRPAALARGVVRFVAGFALLLIAFVIALPGFASARSFLFVQSGMLIAALVVENLIGPDLRRRRPSR